MRLVQRRPRPLSEQECQARLYGARTNLVEVILPRRRETAPDPSPAVEPLLTETPAVHLAIRYPRGRGTMTGEQVRVALHQRMLARAA
ncbi:MAG TPA: hypothetical protein VH306_00365 [Gaiellaceae bacterium]